jgi:sulfatase maturation enzyme AslB (radical SAM superfamily)
LHRQQDFPADWDEAGYLAANPDVARAIVAREQESGWSHFVRHGLAERRRWWALDSSNPHRGTRFCSDPWIYTEISPSGGVRPCCKFEPLEKLDESTREAATVRDRPSFTALRSELLSGKLSPTCERCHIRERAEPEKLRFVVKTVHGTASDADPLASGQLAEIRIDLNERCNLRCVYCAVSQPGYAGVEMTDAVFAKCEELVAAQKGPLRISLNGHGETTYHSRWVEYCERLLRYGHEIHITTNLAKAYSDRELRALAFLNVIQISLDSANERLMKNIRRRVSVRNVVRNIEDVRAMAEELKLPAPAITFSAGIYDPTVWELDAFVDFLAANQARGVTFWNLQEYPAPPGLDTEAHALDHLPPARKQEAKAVIARNRERLEALGIAYAFAGDFCDAEGFSYV